MITVEHITVRRETTHGGKYRSASADGMRPGGTSPTRWGSAVVEITQIFRDGQYVAESDGHISAAEAAEIVSIRDAAAAAKRAAEQAEQDREAARRSMIARNRARLPADLVAAYERHPAAAKAYEPDRLSAARAAVVGCDIESIEGIEYANDWAHSRLYAIYDALASQIAK